MDLSNDLRTIETLQAVLDVVANPVLIKDRSHRTVMVNRAACRTFDRKAEALIGRTERDFFPPDLAEALCAINDRVFETGQDHHQEEKIPVGGDIRTIVTHKSLIKLADGEPMLIIQINDVTAYRQAEAQARFLALHDPLTSLPNRALLQDRLDQVWARNRRQQCRFALLYLDLDHLKYVNDSFGHQAGDALIVEVAKRLTQAVRVTDTVARLGGDEFAVLIAEIASEDAMIPICERIIEFARTPVIVGEQQVRVSASIGVALSDAQLIDRDELYRRADLALYRAKKDGRDRFHIYDSEMDDHSRKRRALESALRHAMTTMDELEVHYQPLIANNTDGVAGMEALVRWTSAELGKVPPSEFIPIAEEAGLIVCLGDWVLRQACTALARWDELSIAINVSPIQLRDAKLADRILDTLRDARIDPRRLQLEITESAILNADQASLQTLEKLRAAHVQIALDDFGTGYSSLTHLSNFNVDRIKIDRSFVRHLGACVDAEAIVRAVLSIGDALGLAITAEGVETEEQRAFFSNTNCSELQGFLFSPALPITEARGFLKQAGKKARPKTPANG